MGRLLLAMNCSYWPDADLRQRPLWVQAEVAGLRLSGTFLLDDGEAVLANIEDSLPVHIWRMTRFRVRVESRAA